MANCLAAALAGDEVTANAWRVLSDKAWENSKEAYDRIERRMNQVKESSWA
jgi:hypothetical protein